MNAHNWTSQQIEAVSYLEISAFWHCTMTLDELGGHGIGL